MEAHFGKLFLLYWGIFELCRRAAAEPRATAFWPPVAAALRVAIGGILGVFVAVPLLAGFGPTGAFLGVTSLRFLAWFGLFHLFFSRSPHRLAFSIAATALNVALDDAVLGGDWTRMRLG